MSSPIRVGVVAEGTTDHIVIENILASQLKPRDMVYTALQPELSVAFSSAIASDFGFGWGGVFRWAKQVANEGEGRLSGSVVIDSFDILVIHLDCDVALAKYADIEVTNDPDDLPCELPCPPVVATISRLEEVVFGWLGETGDPPASLVFCIPAWATEGWLLAALYPDDPDVVLMRTDCLRDPATRLSTKPKAGRLVSSGKKHTRRYRDRAPEMVSKWGDVVASSESARRFDESMHRVIALLP